MYKAKMQLVLASASPRRRELLKNLGLIFNVMPSELAEKGVGEIEVKDPAIWTQKCARDKAETVAKRLAGDEEERWYLGVDTVVVVDREVLGKPADEKEAREWLSKLSGRWHQVVSGYCLLNPTVRKVCSNAVSTEVRIKKLSEDEIKAYLTTSEPYDKAGAYAAQGVGASFIEEIRGSYTNVVGLPLSEVLGDMLRMEIIEPEPQT
jgi:septum formation protein